MDTLAKQLMSETSEALTFVRNAGFDDHFVEIKLEKFDGLREALLALRTFDSVHWSEYRILEGGRIVRDKERSDLVKTIRQEENDARNLQIAKARLRNVSIAWPMEKQRSSRVVWEDLVPDFVAKAQVGWERNQTALRMRSSNQTIAACAPCFGVSSSRFSQMVAKALRNPVSPVERYWKDSAPTVDGRLLKGLFGDAKPKVRVKMGRLAA